MKKTKRNHGRSAGNANQVSDRTETKPTLKAADEAKPAQAGTTLTKADKERFQKCESTIESGLASFVEVGRALNQINTGHLYREGAETFEDYCERRWDISRQYGYRLIKAAECYDLLKSKLPSGTRLPTNESQLRPMVDALKPDKWVAAWKQVIKDTLGVRLTAEAVEKVVHSLGGRSSQPKPEARKKSSPNVSKELVTVVGIVKGALENRGATTKDLKTTLRSVLRKLTALQVGSLQPHK
jgi:transposase